MSSQKSGVWKHFRKLNKNESKCETANCGDIIQCKGGTTTGMINHLKKHGIEISPSIVNEAGSSKKIKLNHNLDMSKFVIRVSLNEILAKCASKDGFSFKSIAHSEAIKGFVMSRNYNMPRSATTVQKCVMEFYNNKVEDLKQGITKMVKSKNKFSITADEWTDITMKRYMNITLHSVSEAVQHVLGLVPIAGSCDAETTLGLIKAKLHEFNIDLDVDVVASTHDGAAVMVKYGQKIEAISQLCLNHGIHLSIVDVLYKTSSNENLVLSDNDEISDNEDNFNDGSESEEDSKNKNISFSNFYIDGNINFESFDEEATIISKPQIGIALNNTRKTIKFFRKSSVRNSLLQKQIKVQEQKEIQLLLDVKTRWNSLVPMIKRFIRVFDCITKSLNELGANEFDAKDLEILKEVLMVLEPFELAVLELSKNDSNLMIAEGVFIHLFKKLQEMNTKLSIEMLEALKNRYIERRQKTVISLMLFLQSGSYPYRKSNEHLVYSSKSEINCLVKNQFDRLFDNSVQLQTVSQQLLESGSTQMQNQGEMPTAQQNKSSYTEMQETIQGLVSTSKEKFENKNILNDMKILESTGMRSEKLDLLFRALTTIHSAYIHCKRAGLFNSG